MSHGWNEAQMEMLIHGVSGMVWGGFRLRRCRHETGLAQGQGHRSLIPALARSVRGGRWGGWDAPSDTNKTTHYVICAHAIVSEALPRSTHNSKPGLSAISLHHTPANGLSARCWDVQRTALIARSIYLSIKTRNPILIS